MIELKTASLFIPVCLTELPEKTWRKHLINIQILSLNCTTEFYSYPVVPCHSCTRVCALNLTTQTPFSYHSMTLVWRIFVSWWFSHHEMIVCCQWDCIYFVFKTILNTVSHIFLFTLYTGGHKNMLNIGKVYFHFVLFVTKASVDISHVIPQSSTDIFYIS